MPVFDSHKRLTPPFIDSQIKKHGAGRYALGDNLYLNVAKNDARSRSYVFRYTFNSKTHELGLGPASITTLAEAREKGEEMRRMLRDGIDPKAERIKQRQQPDNTVGTFKEVAERYIEDNKVNWKSSVHTHQWHQTMRDYVYPSIGRKPVDKVTRDDIFKILTQRTKAARTGEMGKFWLVKHGTAQNVRGRLETILDAAKARDMRTGDNPAAYKGNLQPLLPRAKRAKVRHHPAMEYKDLPAFMTALRCLDSMSSRALQFCILTATRTSETLGAKRTEFDLENAIWTIPAERMKAGVEHRVPLSPQAVACLPDSKRNDVFFGRGSSQLSTMAMTMCLRGIVEGEGAFYTFDVHGDVVLPTVHGFRSCFRDWAAEQTGFPREACEIALAHNVKGAVEAAYNRSDYLGMRRALMNHWADYADGKVAYIDPHSDDGADAYEALKTPATT